MPGLESYEPVFSTRGNEVWRRFGRTIIGRPNSAPRAIPLSRTEQQGARFSTVDNDELEQAFRADAPIPTDPESMVEDLMEGPKRFVEEQRAKEENDG